MEEVNLTTYIFKVIEQDIVKPYFKKAYIKYPSELVDYVNRAYMSYKLEIQLENMNNQEVIGCLEAIIKEVIPDSNSESYQFDVVAYELFNKVLSRLKFKARGLTLIRTG